ncbi:isopenicillin N synthase family dioxygenase [Acinetobacter puyangensis]|uniref:isopenicillin N synthase family dioxygenase n=1 Tax=Acinetobacter puyangensis TaxID=1096779 RepID=UPI003A4D9E21
MTLTLPLIDVAALSSTNFEDRLAVAKQIRQACLDKGFFYIINHGISADLQQQVFQYSQQFFNLPLPAKEQINKNKSIANRGYEPLKNQTLEADAPPDLKEGFYAGREYAMDSEEVKNKRFNYGPNQWPEDLPQFKQVMMQYQQEVEALSIRLMRALALSLDLNEDYFDQYNQQAMITLRLLHYPPQPANPLPNEKGCGAHTDFGGLTLLLQDMNGGLQVWDHQQHIWLDAQPIAGSYVVNLGDLIARWTNDLYQSTRHRVINRSGVERYSVPFFFGGNPQHEIRCIETCLNEENFAKYPVTTVEKHHQEMYRRTYG